MYNMAVNIKLQAWDRISGELEEIRGHEMAI
jgi:hypothetical protein